MPESELETGPVTVGSLDHRHKIDLEVPSLVGSKGPHVVGNGRIPSRKHGSTVRFVNCKISSKRKDASTTHARFVIRLKGPRHSFHDPLDSLRVQPLNYVHNWTSPTTIKERSTIPARMSCCL